MPDMRGPTCTSFHRNILDPPSFLAASAFWSTVAWPADAVALAPPEEGVSVPTEPAFENRSVTSRT
jgi:hypothetical protein